MLEVRRRTWRDFSDEVDDNMAARFCPTDPPEEEVVAAPYEEVAALSNDFMATDDWKRYFSGFVPGDTLMALRLTEKGYNGAADELIDKGVESDEIIVHGGANLVQLHMSQEQF